MPYRHYLLDCNYLLHKLLSEQCVEQGSTCIAPEMEKGMIVCFRTIIKNCNEETVYML